MTRSLTSVQSTRSSNETSESCEASIIAAAPPQQQSDPESSGVLTSDRLRCGFRQRRARPNANSRIVHPIYQDSAVRLIDSPPNIVAKQDTLLVPQQLRERGEVDSHGAAA